MLAAIRTLTPLVVASLILCAPAPALLAQTVVSSGGDRIVVDGDTVRLESAAGVAEISGDWRSARGTRPGDLGSLLATLGAIEAGDHLRVTVAGDVLFDFASAELTAASQRVLADVASVIRARARDEVLVVGHTDAVGGPEANLELSRQRAASVIRWLHDHEGIPAPLLVGLGLGESRPIAPNTTSEGRDDPEGRAKNRRVEVFVGTTDDADLRAAALAVRSGETEVRLGDGRVEVGDVVVSREGVKAGGVEIDAGGGILVGAGPRRIVEGHFTCPAGQRCDTECPDGDCVLTCAAGADCDFACSGGDCEMACSAGATCRFGCNGGDCRFTCAPDSSCTTSCLGEGCVGG